MLKSIFYIVVVWFVWRWLDRVFGRRQKPFSRRGGGNENPNSTTSTNPNTTSTKRPNDNIIGDYVEFEEVEE
jgi:hypothetical protein